MEADLASSRTGCSSGMRGFSSSRVVNSSLIEGRGIPGDGGLTMALCLTGENTGLGTAGSCWSEPSSGLTAGAGA